MASNFQNTEFKRPFNDLTKFIPSQLKNEMNVSLLDNLFNRFMTHNEGVPFFGYIGETPNAPDDKAPKIPNRSFEGEVNTITPVISFETGAELNTFTVQDLTRKAKSLGFAKDGQAWLTAQENNFLPPIDIDKFANFFDYYWVANALVAKPNLKWNPNNLPEYYVIREPQPQSLIKKNAVVATTDKVVLTGSGFTPFTLYITFNSPDTFFVTFEGDLHGWIPTTSASSQQVMVDNDYHYDFNVTKNGVTKTLASFDLNRGPIYTDIGNVIGNSSFDPGDRYIIKVIPLTYKSNFKFEGSYGVKGTLNNLTVLQDYQTIDGVQLKPGQRVLVKNNPVGENGIYETSDESWIRTNDYTGGSIVSGAKIWITDGDTNKNTMWVSVGNINAIQWAKTTDTEPLTNDWQEGNYWVSAKQLEKMGLTRNQVIQAQRPIIEFNDDLQLNSYFENGRPSDKGTPKRQHKTKFNQKPLFDLYRYDGTHSGLTSAVFYYEEDQHSDLDAALQIRPKRTNNESSDFVFNHGCYDVNAQQLLFTRKLTGELVSVWHAGYTRPEFSTVKFYTNEGHNGTISGLKTAEGADGIQQVWRIVAETATKFSVVGSKTKNNPYAFVGVPYNNGVIEFTIDAIPTGYTPGDAFAFTVGAKNTTYKVEKFEKGLTHSVVESDNPSAYTVSQTFIHNPYYEVRQEMSEGALYNHFNSILQNQVDGLPLNPAFGGNIKLWGDNPNLTASLLMQKDMTPSSIVDLAERMYDAALNNVRDIYTQIFAEYISSVGYIKTQERIDELLDKILDINAVGDTAKFVTFDSNSPVKGFPITLPQMGCAKLVKPTVLFSQEMGINVLRHHDGHLSEIHTDTVAFRASTIGDLRKMKVIRSDGKETPVVGSFTAVAPLKPYKGEMWIHPNGTMYTFAVDYDLNRPSSAAPGEFFYNRSTNELHQWVNGAWTSSNENRWLPINMANILNRLLLTVETRLYDGIDPNLNQLDFVGYENNPEFMNYVKDEFYTFAALNGYNPLYTGYNATDAFTWNYSRLSKGNSASVNKSTVPARWFDYLLSHQRSVAGVVPTTSPHLEPWKLVGFNSYQDWFNTLSATEQTLVTPTVSIEEVAGLTIKGRIKFVDDNNSIATLRGVQTIDSVQLYKNDLVLIINSLTQNGLWQVMDGDWIRITPTNGDYYVVDGHRIYQGSHWLVKNGGLEQARNISIAGWQFIQSKRPNLKLSVNIYNETLLPPYVKTGSRVQSFALTNTIPPTPNREFDYGQNGPIEYIWKQTANYLYGRVRALIKYDTPTFVKNAWGFNWVNINGIDYELNNIGVPSHQGFTLHGETQAMVVRKPLAIEASGSTPSPIKIVCTGYNKGVQRFRVTSQDGDIFYTQEDTTKTNTVSTFAGWKFVIEDYGIPFRIGDRYEVYLKDGEVVCTFIPSTSRLYNGFAQIFTNALRMANITSPNSYANNAFRTWDVNMGYRAEGLVSTDNLMVATNDLTLTEQSYELVIKKNPFALDTWIQALRISVERMGASTSINDVYKPVGKAEDWVFKIEGYNPRYTKLRYFEMKTPDFEFDGEGEITEAIMNANGVVTFKALNGQTTDIIWTNPTEKVTGVVREVNLPLVIVGIQNVVNFLFGYATLLDEEGWRFNNGDKSQTDALTGRMRGFQLEIEKFIDAYYRGMRVDGSAIINPFIDRVWLEQKTGLLAEFEDNPLFDVSGHPGLFDMLGVKYNVNDLNIIRRNDMSSIGATGPLFSAHAQIDEYEHLFIFNRYAEASTKSGTLYDPFTGSYVKTYKFNGKRQAGRTMRPEFGGHYIVGNEVKQNLQASTDNVQYFYDTNHVFDNETTTRHALGLLGFHKKQYFTDLDIPDSSQFNFWRGMVQYKGTNLSIDAYLNNDRFDDAHIDEFWAFKIAEYGDARVREYPELRLLTSDVSSQFTQLQFKSDNPSNTLLAGFTQIDPLDINRWYSIEDVNRISKFNSVVNANYAGKHNVGDIINLRFSTDALVAAGKSNFEYINSTTIRVTATDNNLNGNNFAISGYIVDVDRYTPVKIFNYQTKDLVKEIPYWNPSSGVHNPFALEFVDIVSATNPAKFNYSTLINSNHSFDPNHIWGKKEVGRIWFNTEKLKYVPYNDRYIYPVMGEQLSRWGLLADYGSVDVYEWVESTVPPEEYNKLANENQLDGEVASSEFYRRNREWFVRPVAWAFSPKPAPNVDWGDKPPFKAHQSGVTMWLDDGLLIVDDRTFKALEITPNMHIGGWLKNGSDSMPVSEYVISDVFSKKLYDENGEKLTSEDVAVDDFAVNVKLEPVDELYNPDLVNQLIFMEPEVTSRPMGMSETGIPLSMMVETSIKVYAPDSSLVETIVITSDEIQFETDIVVTTTSETKGKELTESESTTVTEEESTEEGVISTDTQGTETTVSDTTEITTNESNTNERVVVSLSSSKKSGDGNSSGGGGAVWGGTDPNNAAAIMAATTNAAEETSITGELTITGKTTGSGETKGETNSTTELTSKGVSSTNDFGESKAQAEMVGSAETDIQTTTISVTTAKNVAPRPTGPLYGAKLTVVDGQTWVFEMPVMGLKITVKASNGVSGQFAVDVLAKAIYQALNKDIKVRDAVGVVEVVGASPDATIWENDDPLYTNTNSINYNYYGWVAWDVPTQEDLEVDSKSPMNSWYPYYGPLTKVDEPYMIIREAVEYMKKPLTLNDGTIVSRFHTDWAKWELMEDIIQEKTQTTNDSLTFTFGEPLPVNRTSVYINGSLQMQTMYSIVGTMVVVKPLPIGSNVAVVVRRYEPAKSEMNVANDDLTQQIDYKLDYEYTSLPVRGINGNIESHLYYFWVKNKTSPAKNKRASVKNITQELTNGPQSYIVMHNANADDKSIPSYNALTMTGLSSTITKDDTFKMRFVRDYTLRENPHELDLKNVHTEWTLIRPNQKRLIPEVLWWKLTDSAVGFNVGGNPVPSTRRVLYDERNGTNTRFGFGDEQTLAPAELLRESLLDSIINTQLTIEGINIPIPDYIEGLEYENSDSWFKTSESTRKIMTDIWTNGTIRQINDIFFSVLDDIISSNYELTDLFKTSRLSAHSIKIVRG